MVGGGARERREAPGRDREARGGGERVIEIVRGRDRGVGHTERLVRGRAHDHRAEVELRSGRDLRCDLHRAHHRQVVGRVLERGRDRDAHGGVEAAAVHVGVEVVAVVAVCEIAARHHVHALAVLHHGAAEEQVEAVVEPAAREAPARSVAWALGVVGGIARDHVPVAGHVERVDATPVVVRLGLREPDVAALVCAVEVGVPADQEVRVGGRQVERVADVGAGGAVARVERPAVAGRVVIERAIADFERAPAQDRAVLRCAVRRWVSRTDFHFRSLARRRRG